MIRLAGGQMLPPLRDSDIRRDSMIRGTTPTLEFTLPFDTSLIAEMYVTIAQGEKRCWKKPCRIAVVPEHPYHWL